MPSRPHSLYIEDELWEFLKGHAAKRQQSVASLVNEALSESLMFGRKPNKAQMEHIAAAPTHRPAPEAPEIRNDSGLPDRPSPWDQKYGKRKK